MGGGSGFVFFVEKKEVHTHITLSMTDTMFQSIQKMIFLGAYILRAGWISGLKKGFCSLLSFFSSLFCLLFAVCFLFALPFCFLF